jgi:spore coat polysaccharide biosynthesis protein SpsF
MRKIIAIIQARTGSRRLPAKVMMDIVGKPMLWHVIDRVRHAKRLDDTVIATTTREEDKKILKLVSDAGIKDYAGSEEDVLDRYYQAATIYKADIIVRITADCPLIDPNVIDKAIEFFLSGNFDYVSTSIEPTYPNGLDTEVFTFEALKRAWKEATLASEREHVTPYIWKMPQMFRIENLKNDKDLSYMRWTVDEESDLELVREIYRKLYIDGKTFYMEDVLNLLEKFPEFLDINKGIMRNEGYLKSLREDRQVK